MSGSDFDPRKQTKAKVDDMAQQRPPASMPETAPTEADDLPF